MTPLRRLSLVLAAALLAVHAAPAGAQAPAARILVVPFDSASAEPRLRWLGEACAVLLTDELNARGLGAITRTERIRAFEQLHLPPYATLSRATVIKIGEIVGASEVIVGSFTVAGADLSVDVHALRIDVGRLEPQVTERAPLASIFTIFERVAGRLAPDAAPDGSAREPRPPLDAFENYIKGLVADSPAAQATFLETAIRQHPGYDRAQLALWEIRSEQDDDAAALAAARAVPPTSRQARRARFLAAVSLLELKRYDEAFDAFKALLDDAPAPPPGLKTGAAIYNNLGIVQLRRGSSTVQTGTPAYYLTKAADADPGDPDFLFNLGYAYVLERNSTGAIYWLREALRRDPADADAHYALAAALQASGSTVEAARERELARQLSSRYEDLERQPAADRTAVPRGLERVRTDMDAVRSLRPEQAVVNSAQRDQRELAAFHLDRGRRLFEREEDREALIELRRAVYLSPYEAQAHLLIGRIYLRGGRAEQAVDALKISIWSEDTAPARVALAEAYLKQGKSTEARAELERALALDPASDAARRLLATLK